MIPLNNLKPENEQVREKVLNRIGQLLDRSEFVEGKELEIFENNFKKYCNVKFCHGVGSGTDALRTALLACGIGKGDEVITTPITYVATTLAIAHVGATPVFVDVGSDGNIDPTLISKAITKKTKAILPVHMYGNPCDMDSIRKIAKAHKLFVIDDCSHAQGTLYKGKKVGSLADISCFSLYPTKSLGAWGDAGVLTTDNKKLADRAYLFKNYGEEKTGRNFSKVIGYNSKLDPIQAIVLDEKLKHLDAWNAKRNKIAKRYSELLKDIPGVSTLPLATFSYVYPILVKNQKLFRANMEKNGVATGVHYPQPMHLQEAFQYLGYKRGDFPRAEAHAASVVSLPFFPSLSQADQDKVISAVKASV